MGVRWMCQRFHIHKPCKVIWQKCQAWALPLTGGDDYELCFTVPAEKEALLKERTRHLNLPITEIGRITAGTGAVLKNAPKGVQTLEHLGFQHF